jgi:hypothetical protein
MRLYRGQDQVVYWKAGKQYTSSNIHAVYTYDTIHLPAPSVSPQYFVVQSENKSILRECICEERERVLLFTTKRLPTLIQSVSSRIHTGTEYNTKLERERERCEK